MLRLFSRARSSSPADARLDSGRVIYAFGDVHGRADILRDALAWIAADHEIRGAREGVLVPLGDLIDRGPDSRSVVRMVSTVDIPGLRTVPIMGNHESALLGFLEDPTPDRASWISQQARATLASYGVSMTDEDLVNPYGLRDRLDEAMGDHVDFLASMPLLHEELGIVLCHAGLDRRLPLGMQDRRALLWGSGAMPSGKYPLLVVHGHYAVEAPTDSGSFLCIDTEAWKTGVLTVCRIDGDGVHLESIVGAPVESRNDADEA